MPKKKDRIVKIKFSDGKVMMFGNSYKPWSLQLDEYLWLLKQNGDIQSLEEVTVSDNCWIRFGGLKWCPEREFQNQLNREGCQSNESDNPNPRQYKEMVFYPDNETTITVNKLISDYKNNVY